MQSKILFSYLIIIIALLFRCKDSVFTNKNKGKSPIILGENPYLLRFNTHKNTLYSLEAHQTQTETIRGAPFLTKENTASRYFWQIVFISRNRPKAYSPTHSLGKPPD